MGPACIIDENYPNNCRFGNLVAMPNSWKLPRRITAQNVLDARDGNGIGGVDVGDLYFGKRDLLSTRNHFDWWMFPWASLTQVKYAVSPGDVVQLIFTPNFIPRYVQGLNHLISFNLDKMHMSDVRKAKIVCSSIYFYSIADLIEDSQATTSLQPAMQTFFGML